MKCAVKNCNSDHDRRGCEVSFFNFPTNPEVRKKWVSFCRREKTFIPTKSYICMLHFKEEDIENNLKYEMGFSKKRLLKRDAVPTVDPSLIENVALDALRASRNEKLQNKKLVNSILKESYAEENAHQIQELEIKEDEIEYPSSYHANDSETTIEIAENVPPNVVVDDESLYNLKVELETLQKENRAYKKQEKKHTKELQALQDRIDTLTKKHQYDIEAARKDIAKANFELANLESKLLTIFTTGQIQKLKTGMKRLNWTEEDITQSITLYSTSAKLYKLLYRKNFPLPAVRTLQKWAQKIDVDRGLIKPVFKVLYSSTQLCFNQKICVLSFDEMKIKKSYCYNRSSDTTLAPVSYVQVAMLRGLIAKWKQPIFYDFDCRMTKDILYSILEKTKSCGFTVIAIVSDLGGGNRALLNELGVSELEPWFTFHDARIFSFCDIPHLIKLLRNHYIDTGFTINGKEVTKDVIRKLLQLTSGDINITHKISEDNLNVTGAKRQKVKLATKLFSHTIAQAVSRAGSLGFLDGYNWNDTHELLKLTNDWFDIMNVRVPRADIRTRCHAYGLAIEEQNNKLKIPWFPWKKEY